MKNVLTQMKRSGSKYFVTSLEKPRTANLVCIKLCNIWCYFGGT